MGRHSSNTFVLQSSSVSRRHAGSPGWFVLAVGLTLGGCDSEESPWIPVIEELCAAYEECCEARGSSNSHYSCVTHLKDDTRDKAYDAREGGACREAIQAARQGGAMCMDSPQNASFRRACANLLAGKRLPGDKQPGEACETSSDCALPAQAKSAYCTSRLVLLPDSTTKEELFCEVTFVGSVGERCEELPRGRQVHCDRQAGLSCDYHSDTCQPRLAEGEACTRYDCRENLYCPSYSDDARCTESPGAGAQCDVLNETCGESAYCPYHDSDPPYVCRAKRADGEACTYEAQCTQGGCNKQVCGPLLDGTIRCY